MLKDEEGNLRFLVDRDWRTLVEKEDIDYIETLLQDFLERARLHPEELFKQLSSLGVGPLVTQVTGSKISDHVPESELRSRFVQL